jgi:hypothetical protein
LPRNAAHYSQLWLAKCEATQTGLLHLWDIYPAIEHAIRLGEVEATDEADAIEKAAEKFEQPATKLTAVRRP